MAASQPRQSAKYYREYRKRKKTQAVQVRKKVELFDFVLSRRHAVTPTELTTLICQLANLVEKGNSSHDLRKHVSDSITS